MTDRVSRARTTKKAGTTKATTKTATPAKKAAPIKKAAQKVATAKKAASVKKAAAKKAAAKKAAPSKQAAPAKAAAKKATKQAAPRARVRAVAAAPVPAAPTGPQVSVATDAHAAAATPAAKIRKVRGISEMRHFFRTNDTPVYFVGATPFNLLGLDRWVRNFSYVTYYDGWDGAHPRVFTPQHKPYVEFESGEEINNWLLQNAEVRAYMKGPRGGPRPKVAMVFFDAETERICEELGYDLILPSAALREHLDSKIVTTQLGNEAGAKSVPNVLTRVETYDEVLAAATTAKLGTDLVIQTPYGDSGKTTFFIASQSDWNKSRKDIVGQDVKIMKRITNRPIAVEAVLTRHGTIVGPFMTELTGHKELTPYRGGWCGNEMFPEVLTGERRTKASQLVRRLGDRLGKEGYRGFFEVDVLVDLDSDEVYLGELNPRISGASAITNVTAGAYADVPLFLFHLMEFMGVDFELDVDEVNDRWSDLASSDLWSQMIIKETNPIVEHIDAAPATGQYTLDGTGAMVFRRAALDWHQLQNENECFFLRIYGAGDYRWKGADLGVMVTKGRLQTEGRSANATSRLTIRAKHLIDSVRRLYAGTSVAPAGGATDHDHLDHDHEGHHDHADHEGHHHQHVALDGAAEDVIALPDAEAVAELAGVPGPHVGIKSGGLKS